MTGSDRADAHLDIAHTSAAGLRLRGDKEKAGTNSGPKQGEARGSKEEHCWALRKPRRSGGDPCAALKRGLKLAGAGGRTYLRCSANGRLRPKLVAVFRNVSGADVEMVDPERSVNGGASRLLSNLSRPYLLATFLASLASLQASVFCLVPNFRRNC